jgi:hypothetical protein
MNLIKWAVGLIILGYLIYTLDVRAIITIVSTVNPWLLIVALGVYAITFVILTMRWMQVLSHMNLALPLEEAYSAFVSGTLLSDFTPARLGDLGRAYFVRKRIEPKLGVVSVIIDRYMDILALLALSTGGMLLLSEKGLSITYVLPSFSVILFALLIGALLLWFRGEKISRLADRVGGRALFERLEEGLERIEKPGNVLLLGVSFTLVAWLTHAARVGLIIQAVNATMPFYFLPFLLPMISALAMLPISPGGLGLVEGGMVVVLALFGIQPPVGMAIALIDRAITVFFHASIGLRAIWIKS